MVPVFIGVMIVLTFSLPGLRLANGFLCFGVVLGGFVAAWIEAKANGDRLETTRGLVLGAQVGVTASVLAILFSLVGSAFDLRTLLDPLPDYIYAAIYGIYDGLKDEIIRADADGIEMPGRAARIFIMVMSTFLFGGFGGGVAASTFVRQPAIDDSREKAAAAERIHEYSRSQNRQSWQPLHQYPTRIEPDNPVLRRPDVPLTVEPPPARTPRKVEPLDS